MKSLHYADLKNLLEAPNAHFLPAAYRVLMGREPDAIGLMYYAQRLQRGLPRMLILAELRVSPEGQSHAVHAVSPELDKLVARYRIVRNVPLKSLRWAFLPTLGARFRKEPGFNWEHWANDAIAEHLRMRVAQAALQAATPAQQATPVADAEDLQHKLAAVSEALQVATAALQSSSVPAYAVASLRDAVRAVQFTPPDPASVSWEARSFLHQFSQAVRG